MNNKIILDLTSKFILKTRYIRRGKFFPRKSKVHFFPSKSKETKPQKFALISYPKGKTGEGVEVNNTLT